MSDRTDALVQAILDKPSLQDCSLQQLAYLAHQYPYFSPAQVLLLQKTEPGTEAYEQQLQRAALHFSNPLQLQSWLQPEYFETELPETELFQKPIPEQPEEEPEAVPEINPEEPAEVQPVPAEEINVEEPVEVQPEPEPEAEPEPDQTETETEEEDQTPEAQAMPEPTLPVTEAQATATQPEDAPAPEIPAPAPKPEAPAITFEPYHTVDYFASQGIKLSQQEAVNDKLGKQVKSFTEWLKTMKRLPDAAVTQNTDAAGERRVENLAAHSLETADVVTESMAEVWLKQGNKQKALEVYNKLSLRYPAKSAYFAAKIESLKQPT